MESAHARTTPKDFFLWAGAVIALYGSVISVITLAFSYIDYAFPDALAYASDPYSGPIRVAMASVLVLVPTMLVLLRIIRGTITEHAGRAHIWVRRWALVLTLFIASATMLIDLITLFTTFLGGEITIRFALKVAVVLLVALGVFLHFLADLKGYWIEHGRKAQLVGIAVGVLALALIGAGFFIVGSPATARLMRYDDQKVSDLQNLQYQIVNYYQQKEVLPATLAALADPLSGYSAPSDPQSGEPYRYEKTGNRSFTLCGTFNTPTPEARGRDIASPSGSIDETWTHQAGETCYERTIDPERYPFFTKPAAR